MPEAARTMTTPRPTPHARSALALMLPWLILAVVVGVLDQVTKQLVLANLYRGEVIPVTDRALLALQGPLAEAALARLVPEVAAMRFMALR